MESMTPPALFVLDKSIAARGVPVCSAPNRNRRPAQLQRKRPAAGSHRGRAKSCRSDPAVAARRRSERSELRADTDREGTARIVLVHDRIRELEVGAALGLVQVDDVEGDGGPAFAIEHLVQVD